MKPLPVTLNSVGGPVQVETLDLVSLLTGSLGQMGARNLPATNTPSRVNTEPKYLVLGHEGQRSSCSWSER